MYFNGKRLFTMQRFPPVKYDYIYNRVTPLRRMHDENKFKAKYLYTRVSPL